MHVKEQHPAPCIVNVRVSYRFAQVNLELWVADHCHDLRRNHGEHDCQYCDCDAVTPATRLSLLHRQVQLPWPLPPARARSMRSHPRDTTTLRDSGILATLKNSQNRFFITLPSQRQTKPGYFAVESGWDPIVDLPPTIGSLDHFLDGIK